MKLIKIFPVLILSLLLSQCNHDPAHPDNALDTGRMFIRASLDGDFKKAQELLVQDTLNLQFFESYKQFYSKLPETEKTAFKNASYEINSYKDLKDSATIINYSNSYMKKPIDIRVVKIKNTWAVDFKYTYEGNASQ